MPTRSTKLASIKPAANAVTTALTVPPGYTYLVKDVVVSNIGGAGDAVTVVAQDALGVQGYLFQGQTVAAGARAEWSGWLALNPGDVLIVLSPSGNSHFWISGTKLPGVA